MEVRDTLKYNSEHEWVLIEGATVTLGVTDYAQDKLGDVVYVELPEVGTLVEADEEVGSIESVKATSELYTPLSGEVVEINKDLEEQPEIVNSSPYDEGWMIKLRIDPADLDGAALMDAEEYTNYAK